MDPSDRSIHEALLARSRVRPDQLYRLGRALAAWADEGRSPSLEALAVSADLGPRIVAALLTKLEEASLVERGEDEIRITVPSDAIRERARGLAGQFETLRTQDSRRLDSLAEYARASDCRASFLRAYFGEEDAEECGLCDNCQEREPRSAGFFAPIAAPEPPKRKGRSRPKGRAKGRKKGSRRSPGQAPPPGSPSSRPQDEAFLPRRRRRRRRRRRGGQSQGNSSSTPSGS